MGCYLITVGSPKSYTLEFLPAVETDIKKLGDFFTSPLQQYEHVLYNEIGLGATASVIADTLENWFANEKRKDSDQVILYIAGHGAYKFGQFEEPCLLVAGSDPNKPRSVLKLQELASLLFDGLNRRPANVLLILDICYAGRAAGKAIAPIADHANSRLQSGSGLWVIGTSDAEAVAYDGQFVRAFLDVIHDEAWQPAEEYFSIDSLVEGMNDWFEQQKIKQEAIYAAAGGKRANRFIRAEKKASLPQDITDFSYWDLKARGVDYVGSAEWFFTGRTAVLSELASWLAGENSSRSMYIITGAPGSGKSAVLGRLALSALGSTREIIKEGLSLGADDATLPPIGCVQVCLNARALDLREVVAVITRQLGIKADSPAVLIQSCSDKKSPLGFVIDSLDEAREPARILNDLLLPMSSLPHLRLVVGSRRLRLLADVARVKVVDLDIPAYFSSADIADYISARLIRSPRMHREQEQERQNIVSGLARLVADKADHSFLYARVVSRYLVDYLSKVDMHHQGWEQRIELPANVTDAFGEDLGRFDPAVKSRIMDLLIPLAYARGKGLPYKQIWKTIASTISGRTITNNDIRELIESAGYYLIRDIENEEPVYRLFHQAFTDYLKKCTADEGVEEKFTEALLLIRGRDPDGKLSWRETKEPYLLKYYAEHAAKAGLLEKDMYNIDFLLYYPAENLLPFLPAIQSAMGRKTASAYRRSSHWLKYGSALFLSHLQWRAFEYDALELVNALKKERFTLPWTCLWANWDIELSSYVIGRSEVLLTCIATYSDAEVGPIAVCGYMDGSIKVWLLSVGKLYQVFSVPYLQPQDFSTKMEIPSLIGIERKGDDLFIVVVWERTIALYALDRANYLKTRILDHKISALEMIQVGNDLLLVTASTYLSTRTGYSNLAVWQIPDLEIVKQETKASPSAISSISAGRLNGAPVLVSFGDSYNNGERVERNLIKVWSIPELQLLWKSAAEDEGGYLEKGVAFNIEEELWILAFGSSSKFLLCNTKGYQMIVASGMTDDNVTDIIGHRLKDGRLDLIAALYSDLRAYFIEFTNGQPDLKRHKTGIPIPTHAWAKPLLVNGRLCLVNRDSQQIQIWDFEEVLNGTFAKTKEGSDEYRLKEGDFYLKVCHSPEHIIGLTYFGELVLWDWNGNRLLDRHYPFGLRHMAIGIMDGQARLVAANDTTIFIIDTVDISVISKIPLRGVSAVRDLRVYHYQERWVALTAVKGMKDNKYSARFWDLGNGKEFVLKGKLGEYKFRIAGYDDLSMYVVRFIQSTTGTWMLLTARGRLQVWERATAAEAYWRQEDGWGMSSGDYIYCGDVHVLNGQQIVVAGDEAGRMCVRDVTRRKFLSADVITGHMGKVTALLFHPMGEDILIISGGVDKKVHIWSLTLTRLYTIDVDTEIVWLGLLQSDILLVVCKKGISSLKLNWGLILGKSD